MYYLELIRIRTLPLAVCAVAMGNALAYAAGYFDLKRFACTLTTALFLQILSNIANDYGDGIRQTDQYRPQNSPPRFAHRPEYRQKVQSALGITFSLTVLSGLSLLMLLPHSVRMIFFLLGILSLAAALLYTLGRKPYGYQGFGEVSVLVFFGWVGVLGSYAVQGAPLHFPLFLPATSFGLLCITVLMVNNARDIDLDRFAHKNTLAVQLGLTRYVQAYQWVLHSAWISFAWFAYFEPRTLLVLLMVFPILWQIKRTQQSALLGTIGAELPCHIRLICLSNFLFIISLL